ncbi:MAG: roadblock/LC7 domain-containing protein [Calditrichaeota bacterium]|nr:MAG: roadblock/LC7 domain-containing protein [Calditrichota bacterium]
MVLEEQFSGGRMVFSENTYQKISRILFELNTRLKSTVCIFADMNGYAIDYNGDTKNMNINSFTAVAAGNFSASNEMSRHISGEANFQHVFLEGTEKNVYMCSVSEDYLMIVVFGRSVSIGFVRLLTHHAVAKLSQYLDGLRASSRQVHHFLDAEFRNKLDIELDRAFRLF